VPSIDIVFQDFKISRFQDFKISRFQDFKISRLQDTSTAGDPLFFQELQSLCKVHIYQLAGYGGCERLSFKSSFNLSQTECCGDACDGFFCLR